MLPTLNIGPLVFPTANLIYILGIWLALTTVEKAAERLKLHAPWTYNAAVIALACGFISARLLFVARHWDVYRQNLIGVVWPLTSGFDLWAGLIAGLSAAFFYGRARRLPAAATFDALAPGILVGFMTISFADFLAGPGYGLQADLPWSISLFGVRRHPVQIYELLGAIIALLAWAQATRKPDFAGRPFLITAALFSAGRLFVDAYRADPLLTAGGLHVVQLVAFAVLMAALLLLMRHATRVPPDHA